MKKRTTPHQHTKPKQQLGKNQVRIIAGQYRRRQLSFVDAEGLRPTPDRLRETLFNWLMGYLQQSSVLDMCAGSGCLGFEALSRGAKSVIFIESYTPQSRLLKENATLLQLEKQTTIINDDARTALPKLTGRFDVVFIDPPYAANLWQELLEQLIQHQLIDTDSLIYLEADKPLTTVLSEDLCQRFSVLKSTKVGQAHAFLLKMID